MYGIQSYEKKVKEVCIAFHKKPVLQLLTSPAIWIITHS